VTAADREAKSVAPAASGVLQTVAPVMNAAGSGPRQPAAGPVVRPAPQRRTALPARLQAAAALVVPQARYWIARLGTAGQVGLAALAAAAVLALSALLPAQHALQTLSADLARTRQSPVTASAGAGTPTLLASLPTRTQMPAVIGQVFAEAKAAGVPLDTGHYVYTAAKGEALARYELEFPIKASYPDVRHFIDLTLAAVPAAALGKLRLERKAVGDAIVVADVVFVVFVREGEQS
jgi:hypothetical protein